VVPSSTGLAGFLERAGRYLLVAEGAAWVRHAQLEECVLCLCSGLWSREARRRLEVYGLADRYER
jgi:hypothetical protein